jgi:hypothetical protein
MYTVELPKFFAVAGRFFLTQVLEVWILGTVKVFH